MTDIIENAGRRIPPLPPAKKNLKIPQRKKSSP